MPTYLSDQERDDSYELAIGYIRQAKALNTQVKNLRLNASKNAKNFGSTGAEMDSILTDAAVLDALAQAVLAAINDKAQPVAAETEGGITSIAIDQSSNELTIVAADADYTDYPTTGTIQVSGSRLGNNGTYDVSSRTGGVITIDGTPAFLADESNTADHLKVTWKTY